MRDPDAESMVSARVLTPFTGREALWARGAIANPGLISAHQSLLPRRFPLSRTPPVPETGNEIDWYEKPEQ
jgi:hypothetical protein